MNKKTIVIGDGSKAHPFDTVKLNATETTISQHPFVSHFILRTSDGDRIDISSAENSGEAYLEINDNNECVMSADDIESLKKMLDRTLNFMQSDSDD